jgi:hypothetical protein
VAGWGVGASANRLRLRLDRESLFVSHASFQIDWHRAWHPPWCEPSHRSPSRMTAFIIRRRPVRSTRSFTLSMRFSTANSCPQRLAISGMNGSPSRQPSWSSVSRISCSGRTLTRSPTLRDLVILVFTGALGPFAFSASSRPQRRRRAPRDDSGSRPPTAHCRGRECPRAADDP